MDDTIDSLRAERDRALERLGQTQATAPPEPDNGNGQQPAQ